MEPTKEVLDAALEGRIWTEPAVCVATANIESTESRNSERLSGTHQRDSKLSTEGFP
jgi:hypothetical protein